MNDSSYIIHGGEHGADRLRILADAMWPYTQPFLERAGIRKGMRCLDVGCGNGEITKRISSIIGDDGHITGIDFDPAVINIAQNENSELSNAIFDVMDVQDDAFDLSGFDFIFCRFILSHLQAPEVVVMKLYNALQPGGIIAIEDVDFQGHFCFPSNSAFNKYIEWYEQLGIRRNANPMIGPLLLTMVSDIGFHDVDMKVVLPAFHVGDGKLLAILTLQAIKNSIIEEGLATMEEVNAVLTELQSFTHTRFSIMSLPRIFQVYGKNI